MASIGIGFPAMVLLRVLGLQPSPGQFGDLANSRPRLRTVEVDLGRTGTGDSPLGMSHPVSLNVVDPLQVRDGPLASSS